MPPMSSKALYLTRPDPAVAAGEQLENALELLRMAPQELAVLVDPLEKLLEGSLGALRLVDLRHAAEGAFEPREAAPA